MLQKIEYVYLESMPLSFQVAYLSPAGCAYTSILSPVVLVTTG